MQRHAAKSCPGRPRRIDKAVGAFAPTPLGLLGFVARRRTYMDASHVASGIWKFRFGGFIAVLYPACALADRSPRLALMVIREAGSDLTCGLARRSP
jgi:hypothetical protein